MLLLDNLERRSVLKIMPSFRVGLLFSIASLTTTLNADTLWLASDAAAYQAHVTTTGALINSITIPRITGFAWDGSILYASKADSPGEIDRLTADGTFISSFDAAYTTSFGEDMAWDSKRNRLWRVEHSPGSISKINPSNGNIDANYALISTDPTGGLSGTLGGLGVAYDSLRDLLYVSFCRAGCGAPGGLVTVYDPATGTYLGNMFYTKDYAGGLAYDAIGDTLWSEQGLSSDPFVRHVTLTGAVISEFHNPTSFADGFELIQAPVPEPGTVTLLLTALAGVLWLERKRRLRRA